MSSLEDIFNTATLDVVVPDTSLGFVSGEPNPVEWLKQLKLNTTSRQTVFFGGSISLRLYVGVKLAFSCLDSLLVSLYMK